jgi:pyruvate kinase
MSSVSHEASPYPSYIQTIVCISDTGSRNVVTSDYKPHYFIYVISEQHEATLSISGQQVGD